MRSRKLRKAFVVASMIALGASALEGAESEESWLPPRVVEGAAEHLAVQLQQVGFEPDDDAARAASARRFVDALRDELEALGAQGVLELAPEFSRVALPSAGQRYLDAMARFQLCSLDLMLRLQDPAHQDDPVVRRDATLGLMAMTLAVVRLRQPLLAQGGSDSGIEAFLTSPKMEPLYQSVQAEAELRAYVESTCAPVLGGLLEGPLRTFGATPPAD